MRPERVKYYLKGTAILLIIWAMILLCCYGLATNGSANVRKIFYIVFLSVMGASFIAYWIYAFIYEKKHPDAGDNNKKGR
jgi:hypothetical protein